MKRISCIILAIVLVMGLSVTSFAGASSGYYDDYIPIGVYCAICTLDIKSSSATATTSFDKYGFCQLSASIVGYYRNAYGNIVPSPATNGNSNEWYDVSTSISNGGGTWSDVSSSHSASGGGFSGSRSLPNK